HHGDLVRQGTRLSPKDRDNGPAVLARIDVGQVVVAFRVAVVAGEVLDAVVRLDDVAIRREGLARQGLNGQAEGRGGGHAMLRGGRPQSLNKASRRKRAIWPICSRDVENSTFRSLCSRCSMASMI